MTEYQHLLFATQTVPKNLKAENGHAQTLRVLLFDADPVFATYVTTLLKHRSEIQLTLTHCRDLQDLQRFDVEMEFDVVLLDLGHPAAHAAETLEALCDKFGQTPIVVLTGNDDESTACSCVDIDAADSLSKSSVDGDLLVRSLRFAIERHRRKSLELRIQNLDQFASIVAHDLQSPLQAVDTLVTWIATDLESQISQRSREDLSTLRGRVVRMSDMIAGLLAYGRASQVHARKQLVNCGRLLADVIAILDVPLGITIHLSAGMPTFITTQTPLATCLRNLIANAIKHHHCSQGRIEVDCREVADHFEFMVTDDGPGIPPHFHERIFLPLETLAPRDNVEASGIGLAVVRRTAEAHGGYVEVESDGQNGSTFHLGWPKSIR